MTEAKQVNYTLPSAPPDLIFKYRKIRANPSANIWGSGETGTVTYIPERFEHIKGRGNFVYYYGMELPSKTIAPPEAVYAVNPVKRRFINLIKLFASQDGIFLLVGPVLMGKKRRARLLNRTLQLFNEEADMTLTPYYLEEGYYCPVDTQILNFTHAFLKSLNVLDEVAYHTAEIIACMFEFDNAYRFRIHDLLNEADRDALFDRMPKELGRLLILLGEREHTGESNSVSSKFQKAGKLLAYAWRLPAFKRAWRKGIEAISWEDVKLDEADIYHTLLYSDYDMKGRTLEERFNIYRGIHGDDMTKWPPRIRIQSKA